MMSDEREEDGVMKNHREGAVCSLAERTNTATSSPKHLPELFVVWKEGPSQWSRCIQCACVRACVCSFTV